MLYWEADTLLVPKQVGSSAKFEITDEGEVLDFLLGYPGLMIHGILHTHPLFESFLPIVDLHQLFNYTCVNPSTISIVLATEKNTYPAYSLTQKGMDCLITCRKGGFHRHKCGLYLIFIKYECFYFV